MQRAFIRFNSSIPRIQPTMTGRIRDFFRTSTAKSVFLTFVFGTVVVEAMKNRKELEDLNETYKAKFSVLQDTIEKLEQGKQVDVPAELKLANALTRNKFNTTNEVDVDEQWTQFVKMVLDPEQVPQKEAEKEPEQAPEKINTNKFL